MKKLLCLIITIAMLLSLCACGSQKQSNEENDQTVYWGMLSLGGETEDELQERIQNIAKSSSISEDDYNAIKNRKYVFFDDLTSGLMALESGKISYFDLNDASAEYIMAQNPGKFMKNEPTAGVSKLKLSYSMASTEENEDIILMLNSAIEELRADGTLDNLNNEYLYNNKEAIAVDMPVIENAVTYKVILTGDLPPMDYLTADNKAAGYNAALLSEISERLNINFEIITANSASRYTSLSSGNADLCFWCVSSAMVSETGELTNETTSVDLPKGMIMTDSYLVLDKAYISKND